MGVLIDSDLSEKVVLTRRNMEEPVKNIMSLPLIRVYEKVSRCPGGVPRKCYTHLSPKVTRIVFIGATFFAGIMVFMIPHEAEAVENARQRR